MATLPRPLRWAILLALSALLSTVFDRAGIPAALLIGPMLAGVVCGVAGLGLAVPAALYTGAQTVIGVLIAASIEMAVVILVVEDWPLVLGVVVATLAASMVLGLAVSRWGNLPGTTAIWGSSPGAASAMVILADAFGADARLVAFMQYTRVLIVSAGAAIVARIWVVGGGDGVPVEWFPALEPAAFGTTLGVALAGYWVGRVLRLPAAAFLGPMLLGTVLHVGFSLPLQLPEWLLAASYAAIGWAVGLRFTAETIRNAARALPLVLLSIALLIVFCGGLAVLLVVTLGVDPLTAYLATSPGGMDSVAIIAAASRNVDLAFVMTVQMARFLFVLLFGGPIARFVARGVRTR